MQRARFFSLGSYKFANYWFVFEKLIIRNAKKDSFVLDAGCGRGASIVSPLEKVKLVGLDILRANVEACKRKWGNRDYVIGDLTMLPFIEGAFMGAISANVLEHVNDKTVAVNELARVTKIGGFFVGCSTNIFNPVLWMDVQFPMLMKPFEMKLADPWHYGRHSRFSPSSLMKTLNSTGYQIDCWYLLGLPQFSKTRNFKQIARLWILFDRLTKRKILQYFKEMLVWQATRV